MFHFYVQKGIKWRGRLQFCKNMKINTLTEN